MPVEALMKLSQVILILLCMACATNNVSNITPLLLHSRPVKEIYRDPSFQIETYKTFSVFPYSRIYESTQFTNEIMEKQMLFSLRNAFEQLSYKFVSIDQSPDFLVTIDASSPYRDTYIPPSSITLPQYVPEKTITSYGQERGSFNYNTYGDYSSYGWGTWNGNSTTTTTIPGYYTSNTYELPGYYSGAYYPSITIKILDPKTFENKWTGIGVGSSNNPDLRVSSQVVVNEILTDFPHCNYTDWAPNPDKGIIGVYCKVITLDGNYYFPIIVGLRENAPAIKAGLKQYDLITAIDGNPTANYSWVENMEHLSGAAGTEVVLSIKRLSKNIEFQMIRDPDIPLRSK